eukprot:110156_1
MSSQICLIVKVSTIKKKVKINRDGTNLQQLKQKIISKFQNITFDRQFDIIDDDECVIDDDDIEDFENKAKLYVTFTSTSEKKHTSTPYGNVATSSWTCIRCTFINKSSVNQCEMCQTMRENDKPLPKEYLQSELKDNNDEIKEDFDDFDDGDQEVQVNADDLREKAVGCSIKNQNIIACIGKV